MTRMKRLRLAIGTPPNELARTSLLIHEKTQK